MEPSDEPFDPWSFLRNALILGAAVEKDTLATGRGYEAHSARMDAVARRLADELRPHLKGS